MIALSTLVAGSWFTLNDADYRVVAHWSTGVEIKGATSADDKRVISGETLVRP